MRARTSSLAATRGMSLAWAALLASACAIPEDDTLSGFGAPCSVSEGLCSLDLVCVPKEPGADTGVCAPLEDYGSCGKAEALPGRSGTVEGDVTIDEGADATKMEGVRKVEGTLNVHSRVRELDLGDTCAFQALQRVDDTFLFGNTDVASLDGLQSLTSVRNGIAIFGNGELESLDGLASLVDIEPCTVGTTSLQILIARNDKLPASAIDAFVDALERRMDNPLQIVRCENGPSSDEDRACNVTEAAAVAALQDGNGFCE